ncbi:MAG: DUF2341 domain-containing protein [Chitinispirillaceae bacterium]|nr:DUF2341 domain-containing protein [Chitinispirillaceae bacterium]
MKLFVLHTVITATVALAVFCTQPSTVDNGGGGSEVEVVGSVYLSGNEPAPATQIKLIPWDYDPSVMAPIADSMIDTSDEQGFYSFRNIAPGIYNVQAIQLKQRTRMLVTGLEVDSGTITVPPEILQEPGAIRLLFPGSVTHNGYASIPGTDIAVFAASGSEEIVLDSIPAGKLPEIRFKVLGDTEVISNRDVELKPAETVTLVDPSWQHRLSVRLNTSAAGAGVAGNVNGFPVLIRLNSDNFDFSQAQTNGEDLIFIDRNGILPHEIERWDASAENAEIWVKVDTIFGNDSTQSISIYWGNPDASVPTPKTAVFDTAAGFQGVWHLGEGGNNVAFDATANGFNGTASHVSGTAPADGAIGNARVFDGDSSYITMPNTASGKLNFGTDDYFSVSAWVYAETFDKVYRTIAAKGFEQYFLQLSYFPDENQPVWQFSVFKESATWIMSQNSASEKQWVLLTGVRQGKSQSLYCNGELIAKSGTPLSHPDTTIMRNTANDFSIGRFMQEAMYPMEFGYCYFKGRIDEVRTCSVARSADWIKLCFMNQRSDDKLVQFK